MSYDTYRPEWDPFFSESWIPPKRNPPANWGDRSPDPKSDRRVNIGSAVPAGKEEILKK